MLDISREALQDIENQSIVMLVNLYNGAEAEVNSLKHFVG